MHLHTCTISESELHLSWIMWKRIDMNYWNFYGAPIGWNPPLFPIIILDPEVSLKGFVNFKLTWFSLCYTNILLDAGGGSLRELNRFVLENILVIFISLPFLEILWIMKTKDPMKIEEAFMWRGYIPAYQCALLPVNSNILASNLGGLDLIS